MEIILDEITKSFLSKLRGYSYYKQHSEEWLVNRAVRKYCEDRINKLEYDLIARRVKMRMLSNQQWNCAYCKLPLSEDEATIDHINPVSNGGHWTDTSNFAVVHQSCNQLKGSMRPETWEDFQNCIRIHTKDETTL